MKLNKSNPINAPLGVLYRYIDDSSLYVNTIKCLTYIIVRRTPKGFWFKQNGINNHPLSEHLLFKNNIKWTSNETKRRYAYPTQKEALNSYISRKKKYIRILNGTLDAQRSYLFQAEQEIKNF